MNIEKNAYNFNEFHSQLPVLLSCLELDDEVAEVSLSAIDLGQPRTELVEGSKPYSSVNSQFHKWDQESLENFLC